MRFNIPQILCLTGSVLAIPLDLVARDVSIIERSMKNVAYALQGLQAAIHAINPRMSSDQISRYWPEVERNCHGVVAIMQRDSLAIRRAPMVNIVESATLLTPINNLETATQRIVKEWIAIKPAINTRDRRNVQDILKEHAAAAGEYADALLSRQSTLASPAGKYFGSRVQSTIEQAVRAYRT